MYVLSTGYPNNILKQIEKKGNKREKQVGGTFYLSLLPLLYRNLVYQYRK